MVGAELIDGHATGGNAGVGRKLKLKAGNIRGVRSEGMVCSERELGLSDDHEGILILPDDAPIGAPLREYLGDSVLEFDIKGGFAHLMCVLGVARETAALTGKTLRDHVLRVGGGAQGNGGDGGSGGKDGGSGAVNGGAVSGGAVNGGAVNGGAVNGGAEPGYVRLEVTDPALCARYTATLIEGIRVAPSPFWMRQRLLRAGMRPINAVVDATNYVMMELGQPIHAFDYGALRAEKDTGKSAGKDTGKDALPMIRVRPAEPGEKMRTLDDVERTFDDRMLLITDGGGPTGIAGVMGGLESEISENTTTVLLESANFDFLNTRRTAQLLKLRTEASDRFGKRLDPDLCLPANLRCAHLIAELCGGTVRPEYGDVYPTPRVQEPITLEVGFISRVLGVEIPRDEAVGILEALEFRVEGTDPLQVTPPPHRMDISIPADLVEEVGRIHGYDRMTPTLIADETPPQRRNLPLDGAERVRDLLTGCGLDEIITYSMISLEDERKLHPDGAGSGDGAGGGTAAEKGAKEGVDEGAYLRLENPLSAERAHLRRRLLAEGLNTVRRNLRFGKRAAVFEVGTVFLPRKREVLPDEPRRLCALLTGPREDSSWLEGENPPVFDFYDIKGVAETLLEGLEIGDVTWEGGGGPADTAAYHPGRSALVRSGGEEIGLIGELHPRVADAFALPRQPVCVMEMDLDALLARWREDTRMTPLSSHPPVYEDLAFVVDENVPAEEVRTRIAETGLPLVREVTLFDLYRGEQAGAGRKSLAYALTYQADDRTLTDNEVAKVRGRIVKRLEKELGAQLRA